MNRASSVEIHKKLPALLLLLAFGSAVAQTDRSSIKLPSNGIVNNPGLAIAIAKPILESVYGAATIQDEQPLLATLQPDGVWLVEGTFNHPGADGGVAEILIRKSDAAVLGMIHRK